MLKPYSKTVLLALPAFDGKQVALTEIAQAGGVSYMSVRRHLKHLHSSGYITVTRRSSRDKFRIDISPAGLKLISELESAPE